jgi:hypothetical protein
MTFLLSRRGSGILPMGQAGFSPAVYSPGGKMPVGPSAKMALLLLS